MTSDRLTIATLAAAVPMGAQGYQSRIAEQALAALAHDSDDDTKPWGVRRLIIRSLRSPLPGNRRLPLGAVSNASPRARRAVGRVLFRGDAVSHRMNLELPPAPHADVVTLHDVVAWRFDDESAPVPAAAHELRQAARVICVSEFTASEASELFGLDNITVIHNGVEDRFFAAPPPGAGLRQRLGVRDRYILHSGGASRRKNLDALAEAWLITHKENPDVTLVMTGPEHPRRTELFSALPGVQLAGRLPDEVMPSVIAGASAVVIPSLYEGFGLPALEAMAAGTTVVAAATSSLPEVVGDSGILVPPTGRGLADGILFALCEDDAVNRLRSSGLDRARKFSWARSTQAHAQVWQAVSI